MGLKSITSGIAWFRSREKLQITFDHSIKKLSIPKIKNAHTRANKKFKNHINYVCSQEKVFESSHKNNHVANWYSDEIV